MLKKAGKIFSYQHKAFVQQGDSADDKETVGLRKNRKPSSFSATVDQKKPDLPLIVFH
jgi:hypothetical protein